jgi:hypothetical protein
MSAYIKLATLEYPRHEGDIRIDHPEISESQTGVTFPCPASYAQVQWIDRPAFDSATQICREMAPVFSNGVWKMSWEVRTLTTEEQQARAALLAKIKPE